MPSDNIVPFPVRPESSGGSQPDGFQPDPAELVRQLLAAGHSPQEILGAVTVASGPFEPPVPRPPVLLPRRTRVARYIIRIDLDGSAPPIWRRVEIPSDLSLDRVHSVLQAAMGWTDSHLHAFRMGSGRRDFQTQRFLTAYDVEEGDEGTVETDVRLDQTLAARGDRLFYEYDFGDGWDHTLKLEKVEDPGEEPVDTRVTGGRRACPPEDVGGIDHYNDLVAALATEEPREDWLRETIEWLPPDFDPADFDRSSADAAVAAAAAGRWPLVELPFTHPELVEMLLALGPGSPLGDLMEEARTGPAELSPDEIGAAVRPLTTLLDLVGDTGAELTAAGYLKPALVEQLAQSTGITESWIGKANREDLTPPVAALRAAAQALGLLRKNKQRLLLTRAGGRARRDPAALWELLVAGLPAGPRQDQRQAGLLLLLTTAAGRPRYPFVLGAEVMQQLGWRVSALPIPEPAAYECARPTRQILDALDPAEYRRTSAAAAVLARAALQPPTRWTDQGDGGPDCR